jgi:hypothetical protein
MMHCLGIGRAPRQHRTAIAALSPQETATYLPAVIQLHERVMLLLCMLAVLQHFMVIIQRNSALQQHRMAESS